MPSSISVPEAVFAADLGEARLRGALVGRSGKILAEKTEGADLSSPAALVEQIARMVAEVASGWSHRGSGRNGKGPAGLCVAGGMAVTGHVRRDGTVSWPREGWERVPMGQLLHRKLRVPGTVACQHEAAVLGEAWRGAGRGKEDIVVLVAGESVAAGIISGGRLLRGAHQLAGCAGWMAVSEADGFEVRKFGGLEAFASAPAIVRAARNAVEAGFGGMLAEYEPEAFTAEDIAELARRGDATARQIYRRAGKLLGLGLANLISLFDPAVAVLSGELVRHADLFWDELTSTALARCQPLASRKVRLRLSGLGPDASLLGTARLLWDQCAAAQASAGTVKPRTGARPRVAAGD